MKISLLKSFAAAACLVTIFLLTTSSNNGTTGTTSAGCNCHGVAGLATTVTFSGFPTYYQLGQIYPITVVVSNATKLTGGFKISASLGTFINPSAGVTINGLNAYHNTPKNMVSGNAVWTLNWKAPGSGNSTLIVRAAGIATNGNNDTINDLWNFAKTSLISLPVTFTNQNVLKTANGNQINWWTADEVNVASYDIEKSTNSTDFEKISNIESKKGTSNYYNYTDINTKVGTAYYRIKSIDIDGNSLYSPIMKIETTANEGFIYTNNIITMQYDNDYTLSVYTISGSKVFSSTNKINDISNLQQGVYIATIADNQNNTIIQAKKFVKY